VRSYRTISPLPALAPSGASARQARERLAAILVMVLPPLRSSGLPRRSVRSTRRRAVYFLCHYSVRLPCPGVTRRTALWSSDFPPSIALRRRRSPAGAASIDSGRLAWLRLSLSCRDQESGIRDQGSGMDKRVHR